MATKNEFTNIMTVLVSAYPGFAFVDPTSEVYLDLLADIPGKLLNAAALEHISRSKYFPTVAELRQTAFDLLQGQPGQPPDAHSAWVEVQKAFDEIGKWGQPVFSEPLIGEAVRALNWPALCRSDNPVSDRAHFVQVYQALLERSLFQQRRLPAVQKDVQAFLTGSSARLTEG